MSVTAGVTRRDNHQGRRLDDDGPSSDLSDVAWGLTSCPWLGPSRSVVGFRAATHVILRNELASPQNERSGRCLCRCGLLAGL